MFRTLAVIAGLCLSPLAWQESATEPPLPPPAQWIPADAALSVELRRPEALYELLLSEEIEELVGGLPAWQRQSSSKGIQDLGNLVRLLETTLGMDWRTALAELTGGGISFAVCPGKTVLLFVDARDEEALHALHEVLVGIARSEADKAGRAERVGSEMRGDVEVWTFNGQEAHAIIGNRLIVSNRAEGLDAVLELRAGGEGRSLASVDAWRSAVRAAGPEAVARLFADLNTLKRRPKVARALEQNRANPVATLLLAGVGEAVRDSTWLAGGLEIEEDALVLEALVDGRVEESADAAAFAWPAGPDEGLLPNLRVPRRIAAFSFFRDLHRFYAAKDELFPERTSGLIFFENMMGIFFSGRDLTDEVLAETRPEIRIVVAEQDYDPAIGTPGVRIPAFAAVLGLRRPAELGLVMEEAWQKALGLVNFTRGQKALPGLIIDRGVQGDTEFTVARFSAAGIEDRANLHQRYNFSPALAMPGEYLVLSSSEALARDLIDALAQEAAQEPAPRLEANTLVEMAGAQLASILASNRETLIRNNMVEKGNARADAEGEIDLLLTLVGLVDSLELGFGPGDGLTRARLEVGLDLP